MKNKKNVNKDEQNWQQKFLFETIQQLRNFGNTCYNSIREHNGQSFITYASCSHFGLYLTRPARTIPFDTIQFFPYSSPFYFRLIITWSPSLNRGPALFKTEALQPFELGQRELSRNFFLFIPFIEIFFSSHQHSTLFSHWSQQAEAMPRWTQ